MGAGHACRLNLSLNWPKKEMSLQRIHLQHVTKPSNKVAHRAVGYTVRSSRREPGPTAGYVPIARHGGPGSRPSRPLPGPSGFSLDGPDQRRGRRGHVSHQRPTGHRVVSAGAGRDGRLRRCRKGINLFPRETFCKPRLSSGRGRPSRSGREPWAGGPPRVRPVPLFLSEDRRHAVVAAVLESRARFGPERIMHQA